MTLHALDKLNKYLKVTFRVVIKITLLDTPPVPADRDLPEENQILGIMNFPKEWTL